MGRPLRKHAQVDAAHSGSGLLNGDSVCRLRFLVATGDQINTDPMLGPLQDNGGPTFTHELLPDSPAINGGDPNFVGRLTTINAAQVTIV